MKLDLFYAIWYYYPDFVGKEWRFVSKEKIKRIHLIYGCVTAALVILVAAALIVSCVGIYRSGNSPFSVEVVAAALRKIAVPGWICLLSVIGGILLQILLPLPEERTKAIRYPSRKSHRQDNPKVTRILRCAMFAASLLLIVLGIANSGYADVLGKAIRICTECIGLG